MGRVGLFILHGHNASQLHLTVVLICICFPSFHQAWTTSLHKKTFPPFGPNSLLIKEKGWKANRPRPEEISQMWKPAAKLNTESDEVIVKSVSQQKWRGLTIKVFGGEKWLGKKSFHSNCKERKHYHSNFSILG